MSNEELESQLSAMFDDELPATECELLARRLARDEQLRTRWARYAAIGACIRGEPGVRFETTPLASKIAAAVKQEAEPTGAPAAAGARRGFLNPWLTSVAGLASAAAVAAVAIFWMRTEGPASVAQNRPAPLTVSAPVTATPAPTPTEHLAAVTPQLSPTPSASSEPRRSREPDSYVIPASVAQAPVLVPPTELANYIVAHSAYSGPLMRRSALSALVGGDAAMPVNAQPVAEKVVTDK